MLSAKNVVKPGYSVFIRQTTSAGVVWLLTTLSHSLYIVYTDEWFMIHKDSFATET